MKSVFSGIRGVGPGRQRRGEGVGAIATFPGAEAGDAPHQATEGQSNLESPIAPSGRLVETSAGTMAATGAGCSTGLAGEARKLLKMNPEIDFDTFDLIKQLRQLQDNAEALAQHQHELREQLKVAEQKALELHRKLLEKQCDVGGEG